MAVPKKKMTKRRQQNRRSQKHGKLEKSISLSVCSNCGSSVMSHSVCHNCGYYKGKRVLLKLV
jgi:large subunit ribosomal protein L32